MSAPFDISLLSSVSSFSQNSAAGGNIMPLRDFFDRTETSPAMRPLVKLIKEQLGEGCGSSVYLMGLFGGSPAKTAAKIAGLPRPTNCL